jgi:hypothetical protein
VPYVIDTADQMVAAAGIGVDALITNDPTRAREALGAGFPTEDAPVASATSTRAKVTGGVAKAKVKCNSIASQTCVGNLVLTASHRIVGSAQYAIAGGKTQSVAVGVKRGASGKGTASVTTFDDRGRAPSARTPITLG